MISGFLRPKGPSSTDAGGKESIDVTLGSSMTTVTRRKGLGCGVSALGFRVWVLKGD